MDRTFPYYLLKISRVEVLSAEHWQAATWAEVFAQRHWSFVDANPGNLTHNHVMFRKDAIVAGVILLITFAVYWPILDGTFLIWDDSYNVPRNPYLVSGEFRSFWSSPDLDLFIPVTYSTWFLIWHFVSSSAAFFHLANILFHAANANLIFWLLQRRSVSFFSTLIASLVFLLHPLMTESLAWISDLRTVLATFFALISIHFFLNRHRFSQVIALLAFSMSLLAKPIFVFLPLSILIDFARGEKERKINHTPFIWSSLLSALIAALIGWATLSLQPSLQTDFLSRILRATDSLGFFIEKIFWPYPLVADYSRTVGAIISNALWIKALILILAGAIAVFTLSRSDKRVRLGWLLVIAAWIPISGIFDFASLGYSTVADRYTYATMVGAVVILACLFERIGRTIRRSSVLQALTSVIVAALISALGYLSFQQSTVWINDHTLATHILDHNPSSFHGHLYLGQALINKGDLHEGILHLETARKLKPLNPAPTLGLMLAYTQAQDHSEVIRLGGVFVSDYKTFSAAGNSPMVFEILSTLGYNLSVVGRIEQAHKVLCHALQSNALSKIDKSTQKNLRSVEELLTANQKTFQPCLF